MSPTTPQATSVLLIEDNLMMLEYARLLVDALPDFRVVGAVSTGAKGLRLAQELRPDLVLLDLILEDIDGFSLANQLARGERPPKILLLTVRVDEVALAAAGRAPFCGLLAKTYLSPEEFRFGLREAALGRRYFSLEAQAAWREWQRRGTAWADFLTPTETALLPRFGMGKSDAEIAEATECSPHTIRRHRQSVMAKLNLHSSAELARWALGKGFVVVGPGRPAELRSGLGSHEPWAKLPATGQGNVPGDEPRSPDHPQPPPFGTNGKAE